MGWTSGDEQFGQNAQKLQENFKIDFFGSKQRATWVEGGGGGGGGGGEGGGVGG